MAKKHAVPGESFVMSNNLFPNYGRIIVILHPKLKDFFAMARSGREELRESVKQQVQEILSVEALPPLIDLLAL
jgi:hypothetical protein